jgi:hypothetical protein
MAQFPRFDRSVRAPRVRATDNEAVRFSLEGKQIMGVLLTLSTTGGLAQLPGSVHPGDLAELQIRSKSGPITALVELLNPMKGYPDTMRPFRFVALGDEDHDRLLTVIKRMQDQGQAVSRW